MAINQISVALFFFFFFFFTLALANAQQYTNQVVKGTVSCLDCPQGSDLSGVQVLIKCDKVKKLQVAYTEEDGTFDTELPSDPSSTNPTSNCMAKIMGGPYQLYTSRKDSVVEIAKFKKFSGGHFTTSKPLTFYKSCPSKGQCGGQDMGFDSSKTVDVPLPREWGLAPSSYYIPFVPIIGIP